MGFQGSKGPKAPGDSVWGGADRNTTMWSGPSRLILWFRPSSRLFIRRCPSTVSWCLAAKIDSPLSRGNFHSQLPSPKLSLKMPPKLPLPHNRGHFFLFQNCPPGEGNCAANERQKLSRGNFCLATSRCLSGPSGYSSGGVRARSRVWFQAVKVSIFGGFPVENPTNKATGLKALLTGIALSEYGLEGFRVQLTRLSEYSVACLVERPTRETQAEQYSDTVLIHATPHLLGWHVCRTKLARKIFFGARLFSRKMLQIFLKFLSLLSCGSKKHPAKFPPNFPQIPSPKLAIPSHHQQAFAG